MNEQRKQEVKIDFLGFMGRTSTGLAITAALLALSVIAQAGFQELSPVPAADATGGAYVAKADGAGTVFVNPAGTARIAQAEASFNYNNLMSGLPGITNAQESIAVAEPFGEKGGYGIGISQFDANGQLLEQQGSLSGAYRLGESLMVGVGVNYLKHSYGIGNDPRAQLDPVFQKGTSKGGVGFDAGALWGTEHVSLGLSVRNINQPDLGIGSQDKVAREARVGGMINAGKFTFLAEAKNRDAGAVADGKKTTFGGGMEYRVASMLSMRGGANSDGTISAGFGLTIKSFGVDYAAKLGGDLGQPGHRVAVSYRWGEVRGGELKEPEERKSASAPVRRSVRTVERTSSENAVRPVSSGSRAYDHPALNRTQGKRWVD